jgi:hypothetical protein
MLNAFEEGTVLSEGEDGACEEYELLGEISERICCGGLLVGAFWAFMVIWV